MAFVRSVNIVASGGLIGHAQSLNNNNIIHTPGKNVLLLISVCVQAITRDGSNKISK